MNVLTPRKPAILLMLLILTCGSFCQITVDATAPIRPRLREATGGSGGSSGRVLPLGIKVLAQGISTNKDGENLLTFILTNNGTNLLELPTSPNPGDFEPSDPNKAYTLQRMAVYVTADNPKLSIKRLKGAILFGEAGYPGSIVAIKPGKSLRILARVKLSAATAPSVTAHVKLELETISTKGGQTLSNSREIGSATSASYSIEALFSDAGRAN